MTATIVQTDEPLTRAQILHLIADLISERNLPFHNLTFNSTLAVVRIDARTRVGVEAWAIALGGRVRVRGVQVGESLYDSFNPVLIDGWLLEPFAFDLDPVDDAATPLHDTSASTSGVTTEVEGQTSTAPHDALLADTEELPLVDRPVPVDATAVLQMHPSWCVTDEPCVYDFAGVHKSPEEVLVDDRNNHLTWQMMQDEPMADEPYFVLAGVSEREHVLARLSFAAAERLLDVLCGQVSYAPSAAVAR